MVELNVLAINPSRRTALVGECKWSVNPVGINILGDLKHHSAKMAQESNIEHIYYALFSRRDFTDALKVKATREETGLFTVENLVQG
jgi:hypothetical protein